MSSRQRAELAETLRELANLTAGALILGQFVGRESPSWTLLLTGAVIWLALVSLALALAGRRD